MPANIGTELEKYYARIRQHREGFLSEWERDVAFMTIAASRWPSDVEGSAIGKDSNRSRMRLRYEGYQMIKNARREIEGLHAAATEALESFGPKTRKRKRS